MDREIHRFGDLLPIAEDAVEGAVRALPEALRAISKEVAVCYAARADYDLNDPDWEKGWEDDTLGLFTGGDRMEGDDAVLEPARISLFLGNILDQADGDMRVFRREVRKTYLHELGHYLGLSEEDLYQRGME